MIHLIDMKCLDLHVAQSKYLLFLFRGTVFCATSGNCDQYTSFDWLWTLIWHFRADSALGTRGEQSIKPCVRIMFAVVPIGGLFFLLVQTIILTLSFAPVPLDTLYPQWNLVQFMEGIVLSCWSPITAFIATFMSQGSPLGPLMTFFSFGDITYNSSIHTNV